VMRADLLSQPGSAAYRAATTPQNATVVQRPVMVAHPGRAEEVAQAVQWAAQRNLGVAVQASGHGAGAPIESDRVLVDTSGLNTAHIDGHCQVVDLVWCCQDWSFVAIAARYKGYRYPIEVIGHAVWLYHRFTLSLRDVEELMLARGVVVTYETIRSWCAKFGPDYAAQLRRWRPRPGDKWHLDEVFVKINGTTHYLWRAVDQHGDVLDILVQSRRNAVAAKRFFRKLLKGLRYVPRVLVTDKLASYQVAHREVLPSVTHRRSKYLNNRAENSHQPTRIRERAMKRFASPGQAQRFLFAFSHIRQHFRPRRHLISAPQWRTEMTNRFAVWDEITVAAAA
jgi:putative transposase